MIRLGFGVDAFESDLRRKYDERVIKKAMHPLQGRSAAIEGGKFRKYTQATKQQLDGRR